MRLRPFPVLLFLGCFLAGAGLHAQGGRMEPRLEIPWNRYHTHGELLGIMERIQAEWPQFVSLDEIGRSFEGRPMKVMVLTNRATGSDRDKPAMWVDGNVHGNEVQGAEATIYLAWWLLEHYESNERARRLLDERAFYLLPSQNPDGRDYWFEAPNNQHSSRTGKKPLDNDRDGVADEDPPDDLDGDGEILRMRRKVAPGTGTHILVPDDPRLMMRATGKQLERADYLLFSSEGFDNDGDGRINEDGPGGYDMNRNWPSDWQPNHIQFGAGDYPFSYPETLAIGDFLLSHSNVAAAQSFHNSGGMILRGPGMEEIKYPRADIRVYDEIGEEGEAILPFYRYMILWKDLYPVHGGFVTWAYEGLGVFSFTNELWAASQYFGGERQKPGEGWFANSRKNEMDFNDSVLLGDAWVDWHPVEHPLYGEVEVGGFKREHGRVAPSFMIEEMIHRNAMFCMRHAEEMPVLESEELEVENLGDGLWRVRLSIANKRLMPTRSALAAQKKIGIPDRVSLSGPRMEVLAGGVQRDRWRPERVLLAEKDPARLRLEQGVPGKGRVRLSWLVRGNGPFTVFYEAEKARDLRVEGSLK